MSSFEKAYLFRNFLADQSTGISSQLILLLSLLSNLLATILILHFPIDPPFTLLLRLEIPTYLRMKTN
jgi:hypothetical protein